MSGQICGAVKSSTAATDARGNLKSVRIAAAAAREPLEGLAALVVLAIDLKPSFNPGRDRVRLGKDSDSPSQCKRILGRKTGLVISGNQE